MPDKTPTRKPRVVIIGGGFGGLSAARVLKRAPVDVTVIDRTNYHLFQPLLYQVATAALSPADIATPIRSILGRQKNTEVIMAEVSGIDTTAQTVLTPGLTVPYDYLIIATGVKYNYFGHDEWQQFAPSLKTIPDATSLRQKILLAFEAAEIEEDAEKRRALLTFILVGAGPTGVEMAGAIAEIAHKALVKDFKHIDPDSTRILLLEAGPRILAAFSELSAASAQHELEKKGVEVRLNARVENVDEAGVVVNGERIVSPTVIWTAGVLASPAGKWLNAQTDRIGRVMVHPDLSVPGHPDIFILGDTAHIEQDGKPLPGVAQVAMQGGIYVGALIKDRLSGKLDTSPFRYWDKGNLATIGRSYAIAEIGGAKLRGLLAWLMWVGIHIWYLIGFRNRLVVMIQWAWAYITYQRGARLIMDETAPTIEHHNFTQPGE
jgi:NADH dehydrogenase